MLKYRIIAPSLLTSTPDEGELLVSRPGRFSSGERALLPITILYKVGWAQNWSGRYGEVKNLLTLLGIKTQPSST
jgi:hypothetical protein